MFSRLFSDSGLSLDRLRALVEVGSAGSIVKAAPGDGVRQSQYSRQIKELEDFFRVRLTARHGKGLRLTPQGRELARISRFFLMGLSNFQRGCLAEEQTFRLGASATFIHEFLLPVVAMDEGVSRNRVARFVLDVIAETEIERGLHDLTLDFGVVTGDTISRPLRLAQLGSWRLELWVPRRICQSETRALQAYRQRQLPLALALNELPPAAASRLSGSEARVVCSSFLEARTSLQTGHLAALLPDFLGVGPDLGTFLRVRLREEEVPLACYRLAWNPRLLRLNPRAARRLDWLLAALRGRMQLSAPASATGLASRPAAIAAAVSAL